MDDKKEVTLTVENGVEETKGFKYLTTLFQLGAMAKQPIINHPGEPEFARNSDDGKDY